ncbi:hypothetical protein ACFXPY_39245 [Streptomyces sp. NPDC059153]|uniref:ATP-dependent DNA ligase n=1 Tax=Streptomyces sp. NPDC059153 TaxID=3346743 RepID=UPI00367E3294
MSRARALAVRHPASYACWDVIQHPDPAIGDLRSRPYTQRRAYLLELLADVGPPIQPVPATDDPDVALAWHEALQSDGIEGIVAKRAGASYPSGRRGWAGPRRRQEGTAPRRGPPRRCAVGAGGVHSFLTAPGLRMLPLPVAVSWSACAPCVPAPGACRGRGRCAAE